MVSDHAQHIIYGITGFVSGGGMLRFMVYVSNALPPLPANATFTQTLFYNLVKGTSGVDPNAVDPAKGKTP